MSNIVPFNSAEVPAYLADVFGDEGNIAPKQSINQLSYKGKVWRRIIDGEETKIMRRDPDTGDSLPVPVISLVVLDHNKSRSRSYYEGDYVEGENKAPRCRSGDGVKPDADVKEPCAKTCAECPFSVKGSKITPDGKPVTACAPSKRIAVVPYPSQASGHKIGQHPAMLLRLAQTSVWDKDNAANEAQGWYAWDQYLDMLRARGAKHTAAVVTRVKFDTDKPYPKLLFSASAWLGADEMQAAKKQMADDATAIAKILSGGGDDGVMGNGGVPDEGQEAVAAPKDDPDKIAAALQAAKDAERAAKAAEKKAKEAAAKKKAEEEAAAAAAAKAAQAQEEDAGFFGEEEDAPAPAPKPKATSAATTPVETGTPAALSDLLENWDA